MLKHSVVLKFNNVEMLKTMLKMLKTNRSNPESNGKVTAALRWKLRRVARNGGHLKKSSAEDLTIVKKCGTIESEREVTAMMYEYTENKKVKWYVSPIDKNIRFPYTYNKKTKCWDNRTCQLTRQRIHQLEKENKIMWM